MRICYAHPCAECAAQMFIQGSSNVMVVQAFLPQEDRAGLRS